MHFLKIILIYFLLTNISYSQNIVILSQTTDYPEIKEYVDKLPKEYVVRGFIINNNEEYIKNKILEIDPNIILFVGDEPVNKFLKVYYDIFKQKSLIYCCNFEFNKDIEISGINYQLDYEKIESIIKHFSHIYILKTNSDVSEILASLILENIQTVSIDSVIINNIQELRKFFISIPKNSVVINFINDFEYDHSEISEEIEVWNKKTVVIDFDNHGIISISPDHSKIADLLVEYTLLARYFKFQHVLNLNLNFDKLQYINKNHMYFKFENNVFNMVFIK